MGVVFAVALANGNIVKTNRDIVYDCVANDLQSRGMFQMLAPKRDPEQADEDEDEDFSDLELVPFPGYK